MNIKIKNQRVYEYNSDNICEIQIYHLNKKYKLVLHDQFLLHNNNRGYKIFHALTVSIVNNYNIYIYNHIITISKEIKFNYYEFKFIYYKLNPEEDDIMPMCGKCNYIFWAFIIRKYYHMSEKAYNIHNTTKKHFNTMSFYKNICFFV